MARFHYQVIDRDLEVIAEGIRSFKGVKTNKGFADKVFRLMGADKQQKVHRIEVTRMSQRRYFHRSDQDW